ncbi:MAG: 3-deoxy-D-manno-octulosonic acid transferase [Francisellaceae bacterium]|nr:3-deoxy-D-manno-octulosonic acid transferase [Francisellaceae bacterium]
MKKIPAWYSLYKVLMLLVWPLYILRMFVRSMRLKDYRYRLIERMGINNFNVKHQNGILLHAVSLGETKAATPIINMLRARYPDTPIMVTTTTPTGSNYAQTLKGVNHTYLPFDCSIFIKRFLRALSPKVIVVMETELWPSLIFESAKADIDVLIVNARISDHSYKGYSKYKFFSKAMLDCVTKVLAQSEHDAQRYKGIGIKSEKLTTAGNVKFDIKFSETVISKGIELGKILNKPHVLTVASTHPQEEEQILDAFDIIRKNHPDFFMILVPRHPERFNDVAELLDSRGYKYVRRSEGVSVLGDASILLGDTMGEMGVFYNSSTIAFVGGSLVNIGGHNVLEPASVPVPVLTGHYYSNFKEITEKLLSADGIKVVNNSDELAKSICELIDNPEKSEKLAQAAKTVVDTNQGATKVTVDAISNFL